MISQSEVWQRFSLVDAAVIVLCSSSMLVLAAITGLGIDSHDWIGHRWRGQLRVAIVDGPVSRPDYPLSAQDAVFNSLYGLGPAGIAILILQRTRLGRKPPLRPGEGLWCAQGIIMVWFLFHPHGVPWLGIICELALLVICVCFLFYQLITIGQASNAWTERWGGVIAFIMIVCGLQYIHQGQPPL